MRLTRVIPQRTEFFDRKRPLGRFLMLDLKSAKRIECSQFFVDRRIYYGPNISEMNCYTIGLESANPLDGFSFAVEMLGFQVAFKPIEPIECDILKIPIIGST